jgi:hypothetical protein
MGKTEEKKTEDRRKEERAANQIATKGWKR